MPFVPRFTEAAETSFIESLMIVTERDMKAALDFFYAGDNLPAFAVMTDGAVSVFQYPLLVLGMQRVVSTETTQIDEGNYADQVSTAQGYLDQVLIAGAGVKVRAGTLGAARTLAKKYVRAFKSVVRSASAGDLLPASARVFNHSIDIDHRYLTHETEGTNFLQAVEFEIKVRFGES